MVWADIQKRMKAEGVEDPLDLEAPRLTHGPLQEKLASRGEEHHTRDRARQRTEDTSPYVNGVLFGFDPTRPIDEQLEGWAAIDDPDPASMAGMGYAGRAWLKQEQRHMGDDA